ncbi:MAG: nuclear transport factor 2 family protein [bacterium]
MGMRSGKALKLKKGVAKRAVKKVAKPAAKKPLAKAAVAKKAAAKAPAPKVVTKTVTNTVTKTVTTDKNAALRALAQRIVDATVANDEAAMFALYADQVESQEANNPPSVGLHALREKFAAFAAMITDGAFLPRSMAADGKTIIIEWDGRMTLAASGRVAELREIAVHEIENGKIVRERFYYDPALLAP